MRVLVTGATGLVNHRVAHLLEKSGHEVTALVRDPNRAKEIVDDGIRLVKGDTTDRSSLAAAADGMDWVFHAAGMPQQHLSDPTIYDRINRGGTANMLAVARAARVKRVVYTSTMDIFAAQPGGTLVESRLDHEPKPSAYERSKVAADLEVVRSVEEGLDVVHVCPSAVYGPGPVNIVLNAFFIKLLNQESPVLPPGGMSVVYVDGLAKAHLAAALRGVCGERYLVSDTFVSNRDLARETLSHTDRKKVPPVAPRFLIRTAAVVSEFAARFLSVEPLVTKAQLDWLEWSVRIDTSKAERELGFQPTPLAEGVAETVAALRREGLVPLAG